MKKRLFSIVYMFLITLAFTSLVSGVKLSTEARIKTNEQVKLQRIILRVLRFQVGEEVDDKEIVRIFSSRVKPVEVRGGMLYVGYGGDGRTIEGYAFPISGPGFWGPIFGMVGVDSKADKVLGVDFYKHSETPGLGARMTEKWFRDQFSGLSLVSKGKEGKIFLLKPPGTGKAPSELDAITGATGTTRGIEAFLNRDLERFHREIWPELLKRMGKDAKAS